VIGTVVLVPLAAKVTVEGTVATLGLLEFTFTVTAEGDGAERLRVALRVAAPVMLMLCNAKLRVAVTDTDWVLELNPGAEALMLAFPMLTPVIWGCVTGAVWPWAMKTLGGDIVSREVFPLTSETVTPPAGAAVGRVTGNGADRPKPTVAFAGRPMTPRLTTLTVAVVSARVGSPLAWITVDPMPTPVTGTATLVLFAGNVTVGGTVAAAGLLELRLTVRPVAGVVPERFKVRFWVEFRLTVKVCCWKLSVAATCTVFESPKKPGAEALISDDPKLTPVMMG
jgi:hypothetical protein